MAEVLGTASCLVLGCHVDPENNTIQGPTTKEFAEAQSNSLPGPAGVSAPISGGAQYFGKIIQTNTVDDMADLLAERIGGVSRARFESTAREFDVISDEFIGQTKPALSSLSQNFREQAKATFQAALETGRKVYYHFDGKPVQQVIDKLNEYARRYGIELVIDIKPLKPVKPK